MDGDRVEHELDRRRAADVAHLRGRRRHGLETLEVVPVRAAVLVEGHGAADGSTASGNYSLLKAPLTRVTTTATTVTRKSWPISASSTANVCPAFPAGV